MNNCACTFVGLLPRNVSITRAFPNRSLKQLRALGGYYGIRFQRPQSSDGFSIIDAIRAGGIELNYSMPDLDELARTGSYFRRAGWCRGRAELPRDWSWPDRAAIEAEIERLIELLDKLDGDPDFEIETAVHREAMINSRLSAFGPQPARTTSLRER